MTMNSKGQMRPEGAQHISPAIAQHAANECERLREINAELLAALRGMVAIHDSVTQGQERELKLDWVPKARAAIAKAQEGKS